MPKATRTKPSTKRRQRTDSYQNEAFTLLLARFDRVDKDNKVIMDAMAKHISDDEVIHDQVKTHSIYWSLLLFIGGPALLGILGYGLDLFHK